MNASHFAALPSRIFIALALGLPMTLSAQIFVDDNAPLPGTGTSWSSAFPSLDQALAAALPGQEIWVATGTYKPRNRQIPTDPRSATFVTRNNVRVYGGFNGTEATLAQRAGLFSQTILSGDLGVQLDISDNAYHVVTAEAVSRLDGFTIRQGNANG